MSAAVPGPNARNHRSTSIATPSVCGTDLIRVPNQDSIEAQRGREVVHEPAFDALMIWPAADIVVNTRGPTDTCPPHDFPSP